VTALIDPDGARYLAERIPGARLELIEGQDHFVSGDPDQLLDAIERFLHELPDLDLARRPSPR
jgi:pimeloyl-ACP methyl ester carboxylesterase